MLPLIIQACEGEEVLMKEIPEELIVYI